MEVVQACGRTAPQYAAGAAVARTLIRTGSRHERSRRSVSLGGIQPRVDAELQITFSTAERRLRRRFVSLVDDSRGSQFLARGQPAGSSRCRPGT